MVDKVVETEIRPDRPVADERVREAEVRRDRPVAGERVVETQDWRDRPVASERGAEIRDRSDRPADVRMEGDTPEPGARDKESAYLIASDKVEGTPVRRSDGDKLGVIRRVMIDKLSGKVAYAVMSFGGFLGIGDDYRAIPWSMLKYNERINGYELNVTDEQLRGAPPPAEGWDRWETRSVDRGWERDLHNYYQAPYYW